MPRDTKHLRRHGNSWRLVVKVPAALRETLGKSQIVKPLHTDSLRRAQHLRDAGELAAVRRLIAEAKRRKAALAATDPLTAKAMEWREAMTEENAAIAAGTLDPEADGHMPLTDLLADRIDTLRHDPRIPAAAVHSFASIAMGHALPLSSLDAPLHEQWLSILHCNDESRADHRLALRQLCSWASSPARRFTTHESITRNVAADFLAHLRQSQHPKTVRKRRSSLAAYWEWLIDSAHLAARTENPWKRHKTLARAAAETQPTQRPFTDDEMRRLIWTGEPDAELHAFMLIAALTGARIKVISKLTVGDCRDGLFRFVKAKREKKDRLVPIHSALMPLIEGLTKDRAASERLLLPTSKAIGDRFRRFRKRVGVHETSATAPRRSNVEFHSFRRWFAQEAVNANIPDGHIAAVIGHVHKSGETRGTYAKETPLRLMRDCVEAVKLPAAPPSIPPSRQ